MGGRSRGRADPVGAFTLVLQRASRGHSLRHVGTPHGVALLPSALAPFSVGCRTRRRSLPSTLRELSHPWALARSSHRRSQPGGAGPPVGTRTRGRTHTRRRSSSQRRSHPSTLTTRRRRSSRRHPHPWVRSHPEAKLLPSTLAPGGASSRRRSTRELSHPWALARSSHRRSQPGGAGPPGMN